MIDLSPNPEKNVEIQRSMLQQKGWERKNGVQSIEFGLLGKAQLSETPVEVWEARGNADHFLMTHPSGQMQMFATSYLGLVTDGCWLGLTHCIAGQLVAISNCE